MSHVHLQRQIVDLLKYCQLRENNKNIHVFSSSGNKADIALKLYKLDNVESLSVIKQLKETFSLGVTEVYLPLARHLLHNHTGGNISLWFPKLLKLLTEIPPDQTDELLLSLCQGLKSEPKILDKIIAIMKEDRAKIRAQASVRNYKKAYIIAVNKKMRGEILWLQGECETAGDNQTRDFCKKYLEHNST